MRRVKWTCLAGSFIVFGLSCFLRAEEDEIPVEVLRLSDRVLVLREDVMGNNVTAIASKRGLIVVDDSGFPSTARKMRGIIEREFKRTDFAYVINTHFHWDHAWGNQAFPGAMIIGQADCPALMERDKEYAGVRVQNMRQRLEEQKIKLGQADPNSAEAQSIRRSITQMERDIKDHSGGFMITPPQITFNDRMTWDLGDLTLKMYFFGRAHSGTDIFIHVPEEGILLTGDIFLDRRWLPLFAGQPELDIPKWIEVLQAVLDGQDKLARVIPGHLDFWTPEKLDLWRDYIVDLWTGLQKARAEGLAFEAAAARLPLGEKFLYLRENGHSDARIQEFHRGNLEAFWSQLVEPAARLVQEALRAGGTDAGAKKFEELKADKGRYYFNERQFNTAGYGLLNSGRVEEAVALFKMNVELFPESWNVYDSLAEAYAVKGETGLAIQYYERSLELNPDNQNAKDQLKKLKREREKNEPSRMNIAGPALLYLNRSRNGETKVFFDPADDSFKGPLVLLTDATSGSASELFAACLQAIGRAVVVGERSPRSVMEMDRMMFPSGAIFMYPVAQPRTPDGTVLEGYGVVPDIEVGLDREMLLKGIDSQLDAAIRYIEKENQK